MKTTPHSMNIAPPSTGSSRRGGAIIIVVLSLLLTMTFLGLFFFNWTSQETANARYFAESDVILTRRINPTYHFDHGLEQLIVGTREDFKRSILWGGRHSMLSTKIGAIKPTLEPTDLTPQNGTGMRLVYDNVDNDGRPVLAGSGLPTGFYGVFYNPLSTEITDAVQYDSAPFVFSPMAQANPAADAFGNGVPEFQPDVDYTYPDHNHQYLSYETFFYPPTGPAQKLLIPSFFRPQMMPERHAAGGFTTLYRDDGSDGTTNTMLKVFRPHQSHRNASAAPRYSTEPQLMAQSGDTARLIGAFPFPQTPAEATLGIFTGDGASPTEPNTLLDVDLDQDNRKDSIYMDLGTNLVRLPKGREVYPMHSFLVRDLDSLLNLNTAGNKQHVTQFGNGTDYNLGNDSLTEPISASNQGLSRSEVNPIWALLNPVDPAIVNDPTMTHTLRERYGAGINLLEPMSVANREFNLLLEGYRDSTDNRTVPGRYGEPHIIAANVRAPAAGQTPGVVGTFNDSDRDADNNPFTGQRVILPPYELNTPQLFVPGGIHPASPLGLGMIPFSLGGDNSEDDLSYFKFGTFGAVRNLKTIGAGADEIDASVRWLYYRSFLAARVDTVEDGIAADYPQSLIHNTDFVNAAGILRNEDDEMILEPRHMNYGLYDRPYDLIDGAYLHLTQQDRANALITSRLSSLAEVNFKNSTLAPQIAKRFTTTSWDRMEPSMPFSVANAGDYGPGISADFGAGDYFPPFGITTGSNVDAFRPELRRLMGQRADNYRGVGEPVLNPAKMAKFRLNINRILSDDGLQNDTSSSYDGFDVNGVPRYRHLIPHPEELTTTERNAYISAFVDPTASPLPHWLTYEYDSLPNSVKLDLTQPHVQEWWARYDRQRLARDIYCLLWAVSGPVNGDKPTEEQAREMAQFAVNVVDGMDRDNVITEFYYVDDISLGWPTVANDARFKKVYGIEKHEIAFNEVLMFHALPTGSSDDNHTEYNDGNGDIPTEGVHYSFIELMNASANRVDLGKAQYRLRRIDVAGDTTNAYTEDFKVTFKHDTSEDEKLLIQPGGNFVIGSQSGTNLNGSTPRTSDFRYSPGGSTMELLIPNHFVTGAPADNVTHLDLDLFHTADIPFREETTAFTKTTSLLNHANGENKTKVRLVLERRVRPVGDINLEANDDGDQDQFDRAFPWVEVDRVDADIRQFNPSLPAELSNLRSQERRHPYDPGNKKDSDDEPDHENLAFRDNIETAPTDPDDPRPLHTLPFHTRPADDAGNDVAANRFNSVTLRPDDTDYVDFWQPHFDRDYTSVMELLSTPLYGNASADKDDAWKVGLTGGVARNVAQVMDPDETDDVLGMTGHRTAAMRFLYPQAANDNLSRPPEWFVDLDNENTTVEHYPNRWYRLLEFLEVRSQNDLSAEAYAVNVKRTPGKINLNTLHDESVYAGLIDDPYHLDPANRAVGQLTLDRFDNNRNWYNQLLASRDGISAHLGNISVPGSFNSRPFRSLAYSDLREPFATSGSAVDNPVYQSLQDTILRRTELDTGATSTTLTGRGLFDAADSEANYNDVRGEIDYHSINRLLAKMYNNSTNRSHLFAVWVGLEFFEAHQVYSPATNLYEVQVGQSASDLPKYRMFCIVDMTRIEEAYNPVTNTFDFRKFIVYRQMLR